MAKRDEVLAALKAEEVADHFGIKGPWRGRWMRARRCARTDHDSDAFGIARNGFWHCWACDEGGDLLKLIAIGEQLDIRNDFGKVLDVAAAIAGLESEDDFGGVTKATPKERPPIVELAPIADRLALARKRAAWVWGRMIDRVRVQPRKLISDLYLERERGLDLRLNDELLVGAREDYRDTPIICDAATIARGGAELEKLARMFSWPGIAVPVRSPIDGALVDIRVRRFEPREGQPKIVGMLGGVTAAPLENGRGRELLGCYGFPHAIETNTVVVVEGLLDYLTALVAFPDCDVLGAVDAGSLPLVSGLAANAVASRSDSGRLLIVEHADGFGKAGEVAVNESPNSAAKTAIRTLGPRRVGWVFCGADGAKDLNDLYRRRMPIVPVWWADMGPAATPADLDFG